MKNSTKIIVIIAAIILIALAVVIVLKNTNKSNLESINDVADLSTLVDKIYAGVNIEMPGVATEIIDLSDTETAKYITGLKDTSDLEYLVVSQPMMTSQAYSLILAKTKPGANKNKIAKEMTDGVDIRKWVCVSAEKVYTTSSGDVICLVMSNAETAKAVYDSFKNLAGSVRQEFERTEQESELAPDMY